MKNALFCTIVIVVLIGGSSFTDYGVPKVNAAPPDPYAGVTDSWDRNLRSSSRFTVLSGFASAAVRDNNTGLVWEQAPATLAGGWPAARLACINKTVDRKSVV